MSERHVARASLATALRPVSITASAFGRSARRGRRLASRLLSAHRAGKALARIVRNLDESGTPVATGQTSAVGSRPRWRAERLRVGRGGGVFRLHLADTPDARPLIIRLGRTPAAAQSVAREADACRRLASTAGLDDLRRLVPAVVAHGTDRGVAFVVQQDLPGRTVLSVAQRLPSRGLDVAADAIALLRERTARPVNVDQELLDGWVTRRLAVVGAIAQRTDPAGRWQDVAERVARDLTAALTGRTMTVATIHGDYWADNVLVDENGSVSGIIDWDSIGWSELPLHDPVHLVLREQAATTSTSLGRLARGLLDGGSWPAGADRLIEPVRDGLDDRTVVLLYWLRAVTGSVERHPAAASQASWVRANVLLPLAAFA